MPGCGEFLLELLLYDPINHVIGAYMLPYHQKDKFLSSKGQSRYDDLNLSPIQFEHEPELT